MTSTVTISARTLRLLIDTAEETLADWRSGIDDGTYEADLLGSVDTIADAIKAGDAALAQAADTPQPPQFCLVLVQPDNIIGLVHRGVAGYTPRPNMSREQADRINARWGVTPAMRMSMMMGSMFGWHVPGADPATAEQHYSNEKPLAEDRS